MTSMNRRKVSSGVMLLLLAMAGQLAQAQITSVPSASDAQASVPPVRYRSPLASSRSMSDAQVGHWRQSNDLVHERGGWKAYARAAQAPDPAASGAANVADAVAPAPSSEPSLSHDHPRQGAHGSHGKAGP